MAGRSPVVASQEPREALAELAASRSRAAAEADQARASVLTLEGWTSARIGSLSIGSQTMHPNSTTSSAPGATSNPIISPTAHSLTKPNSKKLSIRPSPK
jgi:hypothetical protein